ncbi:hypothetical protein EV360DRAFT_54673 [Lentinula raphanica]|nr:hypothetical protein EV360DRAFT_54673 [Lentinula raphanica]
MGIPAWKACWRNLVRLEEVYGFLNPTKGLPTDGRPEAIPWWMSRGRNKFPKVLESTNVSSFRESVLSYWRKLNPDWLGANGKLICKQEDSWKKLRFPGQNGLLSIVACPRWWFELEGNDKGSRDA